ncbi:MAG: ABC transporter permease subunit [Coriobacteriales bacterium]|jgi:sodium transport system permease protein|nr:ABC transporter permease subunit [Coriobacteriales bacterium]
MMSSTPVAPQPKTRRSGLIAIIKKEFARFFTDRRMVLTTLLLPGLMIFALYTLLGNSLSGMLSVDEDYVPQAYVVNLPTSLEAPTQAAGLPFKSVTEAEVADIKDALSAKEADLLVIFPSDFDERLTGEIAVGAAGSEAAETDAASTSTTATPAVGDIVPQIEVYYNSTRVESSTQFSTMIALLDAYKDSLVPLFAINADASATYDLVTERDEAGFSFAMMLPFLIVLMLFSGCMALAPESIAGEKERGTIATMLITPLARWELALGKVVSLGVISLLSGISSFIGIMLALPSYMSSASGGDTAANAAFYGMGDYTMLLAVTLSTVLMFTGMVSVISAYARTLKEAGTLVSPLMVLVMLVGALGMFSQGAATELWYYLIPIYNSVQSFVGVFSFTAEPLFVTLTTCVNLVVTGLCVLTMTKMFNSEKILFKR